MLVCYCVAMRGAVLSCGTLYLSFPWSGLMMLFFLLQSASTEEMVLDESIEVRRVSNYTF